MRDSAWCRPTPYRCSVRSSRPGTRPVRRDLVEGGAQRIQVRQVHLHRLLARSLDLPLHGGALLLGLGERRIRSMVLRNSMVPVLTFLGTEIVGLLGTSSLIELIFSWGGIGQWGLQSILNGDFAAIQGYVLFAALLSVVVFIIIDAANYILEPRGRERM